jgi:hypothetical protein
MGLPMRGVFFNFSLNFCNRYLISSPISDFQRNYDCTMYVGGGVKEGDRSVGWHGTHQDTIFNIHKKVGGNV